MRYGNIAHQAIFEGLDLEEAFQSIENWVGFIVGDELGWRGVGES